MKILTNKLSILMMVILVAASITSCKKDLTEYNVNQNQPTDVPAEYVLGHVAENSVYCVTYRIDQDFANFWAQHWSAPNYLDEDWYELRDATMNNAWNAFYAQSMMDCEHMITRGGKDGKLSLVAIGKIMKAWNLYHATNLWGAVPATEALGGQDNLTPVYDDQETVYGTVMSLLDAAITDIDNHTDDGPGGFDLVFGGDMNAWKMFAKGMMLKTAFQGALVKTSNQTIVSDLINDADFPFVDAEFSYSGAASNENPNWKHLTVRTDDAVMSETLVNYMIGNGASNAPADERLTVFAAPVPGTDEYVGLPNGGAGVTNENSAVGYYTENPSASYFYFTRAEALFIAAEAAERGWTGGNPESLYGDAITASFEQFGLSVDLGAFLAGQPWEWGAEDNLTQINMQKWVALFGNGSDAWANWRRLKTDASDPSIPALVPSIDNTNNDMIPVRCFYGTDESTVNPDQYNAAINAYYNGNNDINTTLWFMQY